jgi:antitoxin component YwqK of YwqJK toxin-antitoxin module
MLIEINIMRDIKKCLLLVLLLTANLLSAQGETNKLDAAGKKHGQWKGYYEESKRVKYEGTFDHGKETGVFTFYDDTKIHTVVATRDFTKGNNSAYTTFFDPKKNKVSEGNIVNKAYEGEWKYYHEASPKIMTIEIYKGGKLEGKRSVFYISGKLAEETSYIGGVKQGPYKKYAENGVVLEDVNYKNGEIDGIGIYREPDGTIVSKGPYVNGMKKGVWEFYKGGKLVKKEKYPVVKKFAKLPARKEN